MARPSKKPVSDDANTDELDDGLGDELGVVAVDEWGNEYPGELVNINGVPTVVFERSGTQCSFPARPYTTSTSTMSYKTRS